MTGVHEHEERDSDGPAGAGSDGGLIVDWDVRIRRRLRQVGLAASVSGSVDVVVVDRRGGETTPREPGEVTVEGRRVVVVPDRADGAPPVEVCVAGPRHRYADVVRTLRRTVLLDERVDAAFESARRRTRGEAPARTDGGSVPPGPQAPGVEAVESAALGFDTADVSLAVGGFAAAVGPIG
jgi:hypothetical protein